MFLTKLKNATALVMVALTLTVVASAWRYVAVAGQSDKQRGKPSSPPKQEHPKEEALRDREEIPQVPLTERSFRIDLRITKEMNGQRKVLASPRMIAPEGKEACFRMGPEYVCTFGRSSFERFVMGPSVHLAVHSDKGGKLCLLMTVSQPTHGTFDRDVTAESRSIRLIRRVQLGQLVTAKLRYGDKDQNTLEVTAAVHEAEKDDTDSEAKTNTNAAAGYAYSIRQPAADSTAKKDLDASTIAAAKKDLEIAEFYRRSGPLASARFYYELICCRYPHTIYMERAKKRLAELKEGKPHVRVGQIFIIGNEKTRDSVILEQLPLFPGQPFNDSDVREAERNLSRLKGFKSNPKVEVLDHDSDTEFKDIQIRVEEK